MKVQAILVVLSGLVSVALSQSGRPGVRQTTPSPQVYQALGVLELEAAEPSKHDAIMSAMFDVLPTVNRMMQAMTIDSTILANSTESERQSRIDHIIQTSIAICRVVLEAYADAEGRSVTEEELQTLKIVEAEAYNMARHYMANYLSTIPTCYCSEAWGDSTSKTSPARSVQPSTPTRASQATRTTGVPQVAAPILRSPSSEPTGNVVQSRFSPTGLHANSLSKLLQSLSHFIPARAPAA